MGDETGTVEAAAAEDTATFEGRSDCGDIWIDGEFFLGAVVAAGLAMAFALNQAITMKGKRRRKKRRSGSLGFDLWEVARIGNRRSIGLDLSQGSAI